MGQPPLNKWWPIDERFEAIRAAQAAEALKRHEARWSTPLAEVSREILHEAWDYGTQAARQDKGQKASSDIWIHYPRNEHIHAVYEQLGQPAPPHLLTKPMANISVETVVRRLRNIQAGPNHEKSRALEDLGRDLYELNASPEAVNEALGQLGLDEAGHARVLRHMGWGEDPSAPAPSELTQPVDAGASQAGERRQRSSDRSVVRRVAERLRGIQAGPDDGKVPGLQKLAADLEAGGVSPEQISAAVGQLGLDPDRHDKVMRHLGYQRAPQGQPAPIDDAIDIVQAAGRGSTEKLQEAAQDLGGADPSLPPDRHLTVDHPQVAPGISEPGTEAAAAAAKRAVANEVLRRQGGDPAPPVTVKAPADLGIQPMPGNPGLAATSEAHSDVQQAIANARAALGAPEAALPSRREIETAFGTSQALRGFLRGWGVDTGGASSSRKLANRVPGELADHLPIPLSKRPGSPTISGLEEPGIAGVPRPQESIDAVKEALATGAPEVEVTEGPPDPPSSRPLPVTIHDTAPEGSPEWSAIEDHPAIKAARKRADTAATAARQAASAAAAQHEATRASISDLAGTIEDLKRQLNEVRTAPPPPQDVAAAADRARARTDETRRRGPLSGFLDRLDDELANASPDDLLRRAGGHVLLGAAAGGVSALATDQVFDPYEKSWR